MSLSRWTGVRRNVDVPRDDDKRKARTVDTNVLRGLVSIWRRTLTKRGMRLSWKGE
ncbi:hypothetical protein EXIGLDRAFT_735613 [Exidia glandulosa HHB12029]|uniref:Uncharacterized protein n=1 Tax=Exidia glandulosa HHB12029 TaxID=1314781 RepID=A0A166NGF1_EXIGL|nr:hypothetical protein EXIGLDRAFT_735613 [Exidia glandulosa HHB12029]